MSKNSKKKHVSVRTMSLRERRNPHVDDGWPDEDEIEEMLRRVILRSCGGTEKFVRVIHDPWTYWLDVPQRALMVYDTVAGELWMLRGLSEAERTRQVHASAQTIWEAVVHYGDPRKNHELDDVDVFDYPEYDSFCCDDREEFLRDTEQSRRWYAHCLEHVRYERC